MVYRTLYSLNSSNYLNHLHSRRKPVDHHSLRVYHLAPLRVTISRQKSRIESVRIRLSLEIAKLSFTC